MLREEGFDVSLNDAPIDEACDTIREFIHHYQPFESQFRGPSYDVLKHRMPGGAFPSSFEQAEKGGFLHLMPWILKGMSCGNQIIKYFDVTPGSQITWTTWASIIQRRFQEGGQTKVEQLLDLLTRFLDNDQDLNILDETERAELCRLYETATDDLRKLLLGEYGPLPFGWPANWVYRSAFGEERWQDAIRQRDAGPAPTAELDIEAERASLAQQLDRPPTQNELILYLQHPTATVKFIQFRKTYGDTSVLPTRAWLYGLDRQHDKVDFEINGKPHQIRLVSIGRETDDGKIWVVLSVNNILVDIPIDTPTSQESKTAIRLADPTKAGEVGSPMAGNMWRIGSSKRRIQPGDIVEKDEEIANIEVMKTENTVRAPFAGQIKHIHIELDDAVIEGQLLFELVPLSEKDDDAPPPLFPHGAEDS
jgi:pyruvate carboxylase